MAHDRNHSGWWIAFIWGLNTVGTLLMLLYQQVQFTMIGPIARGAWYAVSGIQLAAACYLIFQFVQAGDHGDNRFGSPPSNEPMTGGLNLAEAGDVAKGMMAKVSGPDPLAQIERLAKLRDEGVLTSEEFDAQKAALLKRL